MRRFIILPFVFLLCCSQLLYATHNRAGEITYTHVINNTYEVTITVYNKNPNNYPPGTIAIRHALDLNWGDGTSSTILKHDSINICDSIIENKYIAQHTYPGPGNFLLCMSDKNRTAYICNIYNSVNVEFSIETEIDVPDPQFLPYNNSVVFLNSPITFAHPGYVFRYNPNAFDVDGDSLDFELETPHTGCDSQLAAALYGFPSGLTMDKITGEIRWTPTANCCTYNIAFYVYEYRRLINGHVVKLGKTMRDMQIIVTCNPNHPPAISNIPDKCVWAGDVITQTVVAQDQDAGQLLNLTANGAPFSNAVVNPASFVTTLPSLNVSGNFVWQTDCNDLRPQFYEVIFKAVDSLPGDGSCSYNSLNDNLTWRIYLIPPPPKNVAAVQVQKHVHITWQNPYSCASAPTFNSYSVWRKIGCDSLIIDSCQQGLDGTAYTRIASNVLNYFYDDYNVGQGQVYSYRVVAEFSEYSPSHQPYNPFSGAPSNQACILMKEDLPVLFNASVNTTNAATGANFIRWVKPYFVDLDTTLHPPTYKFELYEGSNVASINNLINTKTFNAFYLIRNLADSSFIQTNIDTKNLQHFYKVKFYTNSFTDTLGTSDPASTIFLNAYGGNKKVTLHWNETVPWLNDSFAIFKLNKSTGHYDSIAITTNHFFTDWHLINDSNYCYYVKSTGHFTSPHITAFTYNLSQQVCATTIDTTPPCATQLTIHNDCENSTSPSSTDNIVNHLSWLNPDVQCGITDVNKYYIYYAPTDSLVLHKIDSVAPATMITYQHNYHGSVAGCYYITSIDSAGNESKPSNVVCMDNCPVYVLPNAFTPNADGHNDVYHPFLPFRFIDHVDMKIFNRWGDKVFETTDPMINWDGKDGNSHKELSTGTFYYVCYLYELRVSGVTKTPKPLTGFIELSK